MPVELPLQRLSAAALLLLIPSLGCTGKLEGPGGSNPNSPPIGPIGGGGPGPGPVVAANVDPGRVGIHRLNNTEYNNTVRDLLATATKPAEKFLAEEGNSFDNTATALGMTGAQYEKYLAAAGDLMVEGLGSPTSKAKFLTCVPSAAADPCARQIIETFGMQIYRRPLDAAEADRAMDVYNADLARAKDGSEAVGQALRAMLASANFLYRVEIDANPTSTTPHQLSGYEMASRLSYLHWSSMPDAALFDVAKTGKLAEPAALEAAVDRLLTDGKASAFPESFAGQWLDYRKLLTHSAAPTVFPTYGTTLVDAMISEGQMWFQDFLSQDRSLNEWFTADFNFVNDELAKHYGFPAPGTGTKLTRTTVTTDQRSGFLGLAAFLTRTSVPSRTSPTERGAWVLSELLCSAPPPPPAMIAELEKSAAPGDTSPQGAENVRDRLERHRADPACNGCHQTFDPIGLGLERFDGLGRYREMYGNGDAIAPEGVMPDGTPFKGPGELGALVGKDARFTACTASKLYTYALGREIEAYDEPTMQTLKTRWAGRGLTLKNLLKEVVVSDAFRFRRGEPE